MRTFLASLLSLTLIIGLMPAKSLATTTESEQEKELAEHLEFFFEEVVTIDEEGNITGIDIDKAEEKFGDLPNFELLKEEIEEQKNTVQPMINPDGPNGEAVPMRNCLNKKIKNEWKSYITGAVATEILDAIMSKDYKKGAKLLIKHGVRGSIPGIVVTLGQHWYACYKEIK